MTARRSLNIGLVRIQRRLGWASLAGLAMMLGATGIVASAWSDHRAAVDSMARMAAARPVPEHAGPLAIASGTLTAQRADRLPAMSELPSLLTAIEAAAIDNHLGWAAADYRLKPASDREPASMEIRTSFVGTYPQIRRMATQVLVRIPAVTFRQFSLARANSDTAEIEAKVVIAILLADSPAGNGGVAMAPRPAHVGKGGAR